MKKSCAGKNCNELKATIQQKHNQVIGYNEQLKENLIRQTETEINQLTNNLFAARNKMENLQNMQQNAATQMQEMQNRLQQEQEIIATLHAELTTVE